jgi:TolA-binding protein
MKKIMVLFLLVVSSFTSASIYAADSNAGSMSLWDRLRKKIESFTPQKKIGVTNAVGGVRGAPSDAHDIYWKGEASNETIDADELEAFKKAMDFAAAGEKKQANSAFAEFIKEHPESPLRKDAVQALAELVK